MKLGTLTQSSLATAASVPPGASAVTERPGSCGHGTGVTKAAGVFGLPAAARLRLTSGGGPARYEGSIHDTSTRDNLRARDSPARPSANERHVCAARLPVRTAAAPTSRVVRQRLAGIGFAECRANAFDVEAKRRPWSVAEPHPAQFACAGVDPAPTHAKDTRERGGVDVMPVPFRFVAEQGDDPSGDRFDVVSIKPHSRLAPEG